MKRLATKLEEYFISKNIKFVKIEELEAKEYEYHIEYITDIDIRYILNKKTDYNSRQMFNKKETDIIYYTLTRENDFVFNKRNNFTFSVTESNIIERLELFIKS